jgi:signal transduction protein with GAF and PtsI domain
LPVGIMIEVPSAAFTASLLAPEVDFFTIRDERSDSVHAGRRSD